MFLYQLSRTPSVASIFLRELRDLNTQKDPLRFRRNLERIGEVLGYELSKTLRYGTCETETPMGKKTCKILGDEVVICSVLRAGLPMHNGLLNYFDRAENAFISAYRSHQSDTEFEIVVEYLASPSLEGKVLILSDPMLATGRSLVSTWQALKQVGTPREIHLVSAIGAKEGVAYVEKHFPENTSLWIGDIDEELDARGYIVPGLGDAGDLAYGSKLQH